MDYTTLVASRQVDGSIRNWCNGDVPAAQILTEAEAWIYNRLRVREMLKHDTGNTLAINTDTIALSSLSFTYKAPYFFMFVGTSTHAKSIPKRKTLAKVLAEFSYDSSGNRTTGTPQLWATDADNIQFEKKADKAYTYHLAYYAALAALSGNNLTNFLTTSYPSMLKAACLAKAYEFRKNEKEKLYWNNVALGEIEAANVDSDEEMEGVEVSMEIPGAY